MGQADIERERALAALETVIDPVSGRGLVSAGLVQALVAREGKAGFMLEVPAGQTAAYAPVREAAERALAAIPGVTRAQVAMTASAAPPARKAKVADDPLARAAPSAEPPERPAHVRRVIAVASGKGGVGKSTVAVNLACAFAARGAKVGLLDADIYGPSAPRMMGVAGQPVFEGGKMQPLAAHGVKVMSIGLIVEGDGAMIWRGPMASAAVRQMSHDVAWGSAAAPLDLLIVDLPPGTGDVQLTIVQKLKLDGAVVVSTPQAVAVDDARRAAAMFAKTRTPVLGVIENMAWFADPAGGPPIPIFGKGGAAAEAQRLGLPVLAEVPLEIALREAGDEGRPLTAGDSESPAAQAFRAAAAQLARALDALPL